jgi:hypothetical protein
LMILQNSHYKQVTAKIVITNELGYFVLKTRKPRRLTEAFSNSVSILAKWVGLIRQLSGENICFVMCWLWVFPQIQGVDKIAGPFDPRIPGCTDAWGVSYFFAA